MGLVIKNKILQQYINFKATQHNVTVGKRLFRMEACQLKKIELDGEEEHAAYEVESEFYYNKYYTVTITKFDHEKNLQTECTCDHRSGGICKHTVAALIALDKKLGYEMPPPKRYNQKHTEVFMDGIRENILRHNASKEAWRAARELLTTTTLNITKPQDYTATTTVSFQGEAYQVSLRKGRSIKFVTSCTCKETAFKLCVHKLLVFLQLKNEQGRYAFEFLRNWDKQKNVMLAEYGFSLADDLTGKFTFQMNEFKPELKVLDPTLIKLDELHKLSDQYRLKSFEERKDNALVHHQLQHLPKKRPTPKKLAIAYAFDFTATEFIPSFQIVPISGVLHPESKQLISDIKPVFEYESAQQINRKNLPILDDTDVQIIQLIDELSRKAVGNFAQQQLNMRLKYNWQDGGGYWLQKKELNKKTREHIEQYIFERLRPLFRLLGNKLVYQQKEEQLSLSAISPLNLHQELAALHFSLKEGEQFAHFHTQLKFGDHTVPLKGMQLIDHQLILHSKNLFLLEKNKNTVKELQTFTQRPTITVKREQLPELLQHIALPLRQKYAVDIDVQNIIDVESSNPKAQVYLKEDNEFLIIMPVVKYGNQQFELNGEEEAIYHRTKHVVKLKRDQAFEQELAELVRGLHPSFQEQHESLDSTYYFLNYEDVVHNMWFLDFAETLKKANIELFGFKQLSKFHFNLHKPEVFFQVSSGIDWFDIEAEIQFGDQKASLKEVQKALLRNDNFVRLSDGTLGVLPEEWLNKYATLFKLGEVQGKGKKLQISKLHFSLLDELYDEIDDELTQRELREKRQKLRYFKEIAEIQLPNKLQATLRDYQKEGYNWLHFLEEFQWGGCLADDMGLGKTLQVLSFLQREKERQEQPITNLIVSPTSLMFNWENEVKKFCPNLTFYRHHGPYRSREKEDLQAFAQYDLIITSYGILTSDVTLFKDFRFHYAVLDESQAIKNPTTKRYKAARLLNAKNRIAITGTPIENNTFDLYAQMNFLNPGMLGSMEFFRQEFANPIDKQGDELKVAALKKIVYPFVLRRTKEMVATELPEKTETVLFCEMAEAQRKVYNAFRDSYRTKILSKIDESGMERAGMYILEGLMKLRQICDSPAILKDSEDYGGDSIKLKELLNYIKTKTGEHKILVFSQFLGMLALIRAGLEKFQIDYSYFDGSTSPSQRKVAIQNFQEEESCRVFLISLKAGSLGLNLTAADYVFLVDPWWNPAVEQQAIDRTHRIGQTKKVFAYKMICTDTVEEKILKLQEKKKALAADLISTEKSFLKKLQRGDVEYLFS